MAPSSLSSLCVFFFLSPSHTFLTDFKFKQLNQFIINSWRHKEIFWSSDEGVVASSSNFKYLKTICFLSVSFLSSFRFQTEHRAVACSLPGMWNSISNSLLLIRNNILSTHANGQNFAETLFFCLFFDRRKLCFPLFCVCVWSLPFFCGNPRWKKKSIAWKKFSFVSRLKKKVNNFFSLLIEKKNWIPPTSFSRVCVCNSFILLHLDLFFFSFLALNVSSRTSTTREKKKVLLYFSR
jgi:hypothetical protein